MPEVFRGRECDVAYSQMIQRKTCMHAHKSELGVKHMEENVHSR